MRADLLGPSPARFFLGVPAEPIPQDAVGGGFQPDDATFDAQLNGQLLAVVTKSSEEQTPSWEQVEATLLGQ
ncbi:hypothetical protein E0L36_26840 [Streptomyces sp. AJS327]|uniref:hypothetical protein n=1 Tax=Streptomyces sp. AJS327 TaxID=2545265 RepID=UPI0015DFC8F0|nr:hypothetical protein [Streptomyces sp. AJS327]MBA0054337.1 hypothetical protein [Streptomyces sp. AJS327]